MAAIVSVVAIVILSLLVTRFAVLALVVTGLSRESARFQARSALTGSGFTTSESESVVDHPVRRRVIMRLMLVGSAGIVTVIASLVLSFGHGSASDRLVRAGVLVGALTVLLLVSRLEWVDRKLTEAMARFMRSRGLEARDYARLLDLSHGYAISEMQVREGDWVAARPLGELRLRDEGVVVLGVQRDGAYIGVPGPETCLAAGDVLVLYGRHERICELDDRAGGTGGDRAHEEALEDQERVAHDEDAEVARQGGG